MSNQAAACIAYIAAMGMGQAHTPAIETVLHNFVSNAPKGAYPYASLISDPEGNPVGGSDFGGIVFRLKP